MGTGVLFDATLCIGCQECEAGCAEANGLPWNDEMVNQARASDLKFTYVKTVDDDKFMRHLCMHCEDPACVSVCPVTALEKTAAGPVVYDAGKCMGCRYCMVACPFGVPKYEWTSLTPRIRKCTGCPDRIAEGRPTACSEACPTGATITGEREAMLAEARRRIQESPDTYYPHVFGSTEVGGTTTLFLSSIPFERFGLKEDHSDQPLPVLTYKVLSKIPNVVTVGFVLLGGIWWITNRRDVVAEAESRHRKDEE